MTTTIVNGKLAREGPFVDTMCVYDLDTMEMIGKKSSDPAKERMQHSSRMSLFIPFH